MFFATSLAFFFFLGKKLLLGDNFKLTEELQGESELKQPGAPSAQTSLLSPAFLCLIVPSPLARARVSVSVDAGTHDCWGARGGHRGLLPEGQPVRARWAAVRPGARWCQARGWSPCGGCVWARAPLPTSPRVLSAQPASLLLSPPSPGSGHAIRVPCPGAQRRPRRLPRGCPRAGCAVSAEAAAPCQAAEPTSN